MFGALVTFSLVYESDKSDLGRVIGLLVGCHRRYMHMHTHMHMHMHMHMHAHSVRRWYGDLPALLSSFGGSGGDGG